MLGQIDHWGRPAWFGLTALAFWTAWPIGLAVLAFLYGSGRLRGFAYANAGRGVWNNLRSDWAKDIDGAAASVKRAARRAGGSGNANFDAYRDAELERLEQEQREFRDYIEQLRRARDKAEFDQFMADRRRVKPAETAS